MSTVASRHVDGHHQIGQVEGDVVVIISVDPIVDDAGKSVDGQVGCIIVVDGFEKSFDIVVVSRCSNNVS